MVHTPFAWRRTVYISMYFLWGFFLVKMTFLLLVPAPLFLVPSYIVSDFSLRPSSSRKSSLISPIIHILISPRTAYQCYNCMIIFRCLYESPYTPSACKLWGSKSCAFWLTTWPCAQGQHSSLHRGGVLSIHGIR